MPVSKKPWRKKSNAPSSKSTSTVVALPDRRAMEGFMSAIGRRRANDAIAKASLAVLRFGPSCLGEATTTDIVRDKRAQLMALVRDQLENEAQSFGITVVDVRIRRANLPEQNNHAVYQRMQTERQREAAEYRAEGSQHSQEIRAKADRDVTVLIAEAQSKREQTRGEGDAERNRIYAEAYGRDPDFFTFYRSMQAYENGLHASDTRMLLTPDSNFFRFFGDPMGKAQEGASK